MNLRLTNLECRVLDLLLKETTPAGELLLHQINTAEDVLRERTPVGFFTNFKVSDHALRIRPENFELSSVSGEAQGNEGVCFILFIRKGVVAFLEGATFGDKWPDNEDAIQLKLFQRERDLKKLRSTSAA